MKKICPHVTWTGPIMKHFQVRRMLVQIFGQTWKHFENEKRTLYQDYLLLCKIRSAWVGASEI